MFPYTTYLSYRILGRTSKWRKLVEVKAAFSVMQRPPVIKAMERLDLSPKRKSPFVFYASVWLVLGKQRLFRWFYCLLYVRRMNYCTCRVETVSFTKIVVIKSYFWISLCLEAEGSVGQWIRTNEMRLQLHGEHNSTFNRISVINTFCRG